MKFTFFSTTEYCTDVPIHNFHNLNIDIKHVFCIAFSSGLKMQIDREFLLAIDVYRLKCHQFHFDFIQCIADIVSDADHPCIGKAILERSFCFISFISE